MQVRVKKRSFCTNRFSAQTCYPIYKDCGGSKWPYGRSFCFEGLFYFISPRAECFWVPYENVSCILVVGSDMWWILSRIVSHNQWCGVARPITTPKTTKTKMPTPTTLMTTPATTPKSTTPTSMRTTTPTDTNADDQWFSQTGMVAREAQTSKTSKDIQGLNDSDRKLPKPEAHVRFAAWPCDTLGAGYTERTRRTQKIYLASLSRRFYTYIYARYIHLCFIFFYTFMTFPARPRCIADLQPFCVSSALQQEISSKPPAS